MGCTYARLTVGNMKRLPCSSFHNIDAVFWQLFYIACYSQLIYLQYALY